MKMALIYRGIGKTDQPSYLTVVVPLSWVACDFAFSSLRGDTKM
jgi:hypothetical protein